MEEKAKKIVKNWINERIESEEKWNGKTYQMFIVWKSKVLQNFKCTIFTTLPGSPYFEITYNGDKEEWYLDVYQKVENRVIYENDLVTPLTKA